MALAVIGPISNQAMVTPFSTQRSTLPIRINIVSFSGFTSKWRERDSLTQPSTKLLVKSQARGNTVRLLSDARRRRTPLVLRFAPDRCCCVATSNPVQRQVLEPGGFVHTQRYVFYYAIFSFRIATPNFIHTLRYEFQTHL